MEQYGVLWHKAESGLLRPKLEIGNEVEALGINVPRRIASLQDAYGYIQNGGSVVIRSEHPEDYDGPSGLADSYVITPEDLDKPKEAFYNPGKFYMAEVLKRSETEDAQTLADEISRTSPFWQPDVKRYLNTFGKSVDEYFEAFDYSIWEYVPGTNVTIVADDVMDDRYHFFASEGSIFSYNAGVICSVDGSLRIKGEVNAAKSPRGRVVQKFTYPIDRLVASIQTYEQVRDLYNSENCPIVELQIDPDGKIWFLQLKKGRNIASWSNRLKPKDFHPSDGWVRAQAVRGTTGSQIWSRPTILHYSTDISHEVPIHPEFREPASMVNQNNHVRRELLARRRDVWAASREAPYYLVNMAIGGHATKTEWFMPAVAMAFGETTLKNAVDQQIVAELEEQMPSYREYRRRERPLTSVLPAVRLQYISDGRNGFARQDPEYSEPVEVDYSKPYEAI